MYFIIKKHYCQCMCYNVDNSLNPNIIETCQKRIYFTPRKNREKDNVSVE